MSNDLSIEHINDSSPKAKAKRLIAARRLANLTREELCATGIINKNTLIGWENARFAGLSQKGAKAVVEKLAQEGVECSTEWLLYGTGSAPRSTSKLIYSVFGSNRNPTELESEQQELLNEVDLFSKFYGVVSVIHRVDDDSMYPTYIKGDILGGIKISSDQYKYMAGNICIITTERFSSLIREIRSGTEENQYHLISQNQNYINNNAIITNTALSSVAKIIRLWRPFSS